MASPGSVAVAPRVSLPDLGPRAPSSLWVPPYVSSSGEEALELAELAGLIADPWQRLVVIHAMGEQADGRWAALRVGLEVARQNGKGGIIEIRELAGLFLLGERLIIHSAHEFPTSLEAFRRMLELIESCPDFDRRVARVSRSHGDESITLKGGQRIWYRTRTKGGGRGFSGDLVILDEAMDIPEEMHAALFSTASARPNPQIWYTGSAVDDATMDNGLVFARVRRSGLDGGDPSLAWFGWEARARDGRRFDGPEDVSPEEAADDAVVESANPALDIRIRRDFVASERRALDHRRFCVERLCVGSWPDPNPDADRKIPAETWRAAADPTSAPIGWVAFSIDVPPSRRSAVVAVAGRRPDGLAHIEIVDHRAGTDWVPARVGELLGRHSALGVTIPKSSPAASLIPALEEEGIAVTPVDVPDQAKACGILYDGVTAEAGPAIVHLGTAELAAAVRGAETRPLGDAWLWSRSSSAVNISPLVAVTNALWGLVTIPPPPDETIDVDRLRIKQL